MLLPRTAITLIGLIWFLLYAHEPDKSTADLHLDCLSVNDGLSHNEVFCSVEDHQGFMWFGTRNGLIRYDGYKFLTFQNDQKNPASLVNNHVTSLYEDRQGVLWIGTIKGLDHFDPVIDGFRHFTAQILSTTQDSLIFVTAITEDAEGGLWVVLKSGALIQFNRQEKVFNLPHQEKMFEKLSHYELTGAICETSPGTLWLGSDSGIIYVDFNQERIYPLNNELGIDPNSQVLRTDAIIRSHDGSLWIGSGSQLFHLSANFVRRIPDQVIFEKDILKYSIMNSSSIGLRDQPITISSIYEDDVNRVWIGSRGGGIFLLEQDRQQLQSFRPCTCLKNSGALSSTWINSINRNRSGTFWVCTNEGIGKFTYRSQLFTNYEIEENISDAVCTSEIRAIHEDNDGLILIGTWGNGFCTLDKKNGKFSYDSELIKTINRHKYNKIGVIFQDSQHKIWFGTDQSGGLNCYNPVTHKITNYRHSPGDPKTISHNLITSIFEDSEGKMWIGTGGGGINIFSPEDPGFFKYRHTDSDSTSLSDDYIFSILEDRDKNIWIGTANQLNRFIPSEHYFIRYHHESNKGPGYLAEEIFSIHEDLNRTIWIGTNRGLAYMTYEMRDKKRYFSITEKHALAGQAIFGILSDHHNFLWLLTNKGLSSFDPATFMVHNYSSEDGCVKFNTFLSGGSNAYMRASNGDLYFGGINGLTLYQPRKASRALIEAPPIVITDIMLDGQSISSGTEHLNKIEFPFDYHSFSFEFSALDYTASLDNEYSYKLEGFDQDWIYCGNQKYASYGSVDPGKYIFTVKGAGHEGVWNEQGASIEIIILPSLWARGTIQLIAFSSLFIISALILMSRNYRLKRSRESQEQLSKKLIESQEEERKRISSELHDSLGQNLLLISHEISQQKAGSMLTGKNPDRVVHMVHDAIEEVREIAYNLHPYHLEKLGLKNALESIISKVNQASEIEFVAMIDQIDKLFSEQNQIHIFRIIQESITNICRHSRAKRAIIHIEKLKDEVKVTIRDNGIGFQLRSTDSKLPSGLGIINMKERIKLLHGNLEIQSQPGKGTTLKIRIPLLSNKRVT